MLECCEVYFCTLKQKINLIPKQNPKPRLLYKILTNVFYVKYSKIKFL